MPGMPMTNAAMSNRVGPIGPRIELPIASDRRQQDRVLTRLPVQILSIDGNPVFYPRVCTNLGRGRNGIRTSARIEVGKVIEFEFVRVVDEPVRYWFQILFRKEQRYGGYYLNDDKTDMNAPN